MRTFNIFYIGMGLVPMLGGFIEEALKLSILSATHYLRNDCTFGGEGLGLH